MPRAAPTHSISIFASLHVTFYFNFCPRYTLSNLNTCVRSVFGKGEAAFVFVGGFHDRRENVLFLGQVEKSDRTCLSKFERQKFKPEA